MSFFDILFSRRFNDLLCNFGRQSPLLDLQYYCLYSKFHQTHPQIIAGVF